VEKLIKLLSALEVLPEATGLIPFFQPFLLPAAVLADQ
jgi:hypothetical protein